MHTKSYEEARWRRQTQAQIQQKLDEMKKEIDVRQKEYKKAKDEEMSDNKE